MRTLLSALCCIAIVQSTAAIKTKMAALITGDWFAESEVMWPGQRFSLKVKKDGVLHLSLIHI